MIVLRARSVAGGVHGGGGGGVVDGEADWEREGEGEGDDGMEREEGTSSASYREGQGRKCRNGSGMVHLRREFKDL